MAQSSGRLSTACNGALACLSIAVSLLVNKRAVHSSHDSAREYYSTLDSGIHSMHAQHAKD